jgi:hypothetical protein
MIVANVLPRLTVPAANLAVPEGFTRIEVSLQQGMPHRIPLTGNHALLLIAPSGVAAAWRDLDPALVVISSDTELENVLLPLAPATFTTRMPLRLLYLSGARTASAAPLVLGERQLLDDGLAARFELLCLDWRLHVGTLRGTGDFGSRLTLAWRQADRGADQFSDPPQSPVFIARQPPEKRMASEVGSQAVELNTRFRLKNAAVRR